MGLPLWQPKVESDVPSRPEAKDPAYARSRIRGSLTRDRAAAARERARLAARRSAELGRQMQRVQREINQTEREIVEDERESHARLSRHVNFPRPAPDFTDVVQQYGDSRVDALRRRVLEAERQRLERARSEQGARSERAAAAELARQERLRRNSAFRVPWTSQPNLSASRSSAREDATEGDIAGVSDTSQANLGAPLDGLGDRNRSLSPEGDSAWDTLLTTLTPDPQPPSVGSSFASASASASAVASQSAAPESSGTSFTSPDAAEDWTFDHIAAERCDSDDSDEDSPSLDELTAQLEDQVNATHARLHREAFRHARFGPDAVRNAGFGSAQVRGARDWSYADAVREGPGFTGGGAPTSRGLSATSASGNIAPSLPPIPRITQNDASSNNEANGSSDHGAATDDLILQLVGGLGGMQHIVRNLVRREDIPNDWWVDAGLSRTLPRDDAPN